jgi:hypothetical protein
VVSVCVVEIRNVDETLLECDLVFVDGSLADTDLEGPSKLGDTVPVVTFDVESVAQPSP